MPIIRPLLEPDVVSPYNCPHCKDDGKPYDPDYPHDEHNCETHIIIKTKFRKLMMDDSWSDIHDIGSSPRCEEDPTVLKSFDDLMGMIERGESGLRSFKEVPFKTVVDRKATKTMPAILRQELDKVGTYILFVKMYTQFDHFISEREGEDVEILDVNGNLMESAYVYCQKLYETILGLRPRSDTVIIKRMVASTVEACYNLGPYAIKGTNLTLKFPSMEWMSDYRATSSSHAMEDRAAIKAAAESARNHVKSLETTDDVEIWCETIIYFLDKAYHTKEKRNIDSRKAELYRSLDADIDGDVALLDFREAMVRTIIDDHLISDKYYIRGLAFIQSSGCGKSRLVRNTGLYIPSFQIVLEGKLPGTSIPQPDSQVCTFFREEVSGYKLGHEVAAAFMSALFNQLYIKVSAAFMDGGEEFKKLGITRLKLVNPGSLQIYDDAVSAKNGVKALMGPLLSKKDLYDGVLKPLYDLRPQEGNQERVDFLRSVISLTKAILQRMNRKQGNIKSAVMEDREYIRLSEMDTNVADFFELIDGTKDEVVKPRQGRQYTQFIFSLDNCCFMDDLLGEKRGEKLNDNRPQGLASFVRVFHDLDELARCAHKEGDHATRRVWLAMLDTSIDTRRIMPVSKVHHQQVQFSSRFYEARYIVATMWIWLGMDHALRRAKKDTRYYYDIKTILEVHDFSHLKLMGRGLWNSYKTNDLLMPVAVKKIISDSIAEWKKIPLFKDDHFVRIADQMHQIEYAIASIRFGLDIGPLVKPSDNVFEMVTEAIAKHMRILIKLRGEYMIETSTPSEPMLAAAAMYLLNYGRGLLAPYGDSFKQTQIKSTLSPNEFNWVSKRDNTPWKNLLTRFSRSFDRMPDLINIGDNGELIGRMVLCRARDCTLPDVWDTTVKGLIPCTTVKRFLEELVGIEEAGAIIAKAAHPLAFAQSLINFTHFVPIYSPVGDQDRHLKVGDHAALDEFRLAFGFTRCCAYICLPDQSGTNAYLPIAVPKKPKEGLSDSDYLTYVDNTTLKEYSWNYIGINEKARMKPDGDALRSAPIYRGERIVEYQPIAIILMDMGVETGRVDEQGIVVPTNRFVLDDVDRISDYLLARSVTPKELKRKHGSLEEAVESVGKPLLEIRIRGLTEVYPRLKEIDPRLAFENAFCRSMARRSDLYDANKTACTIPCHFIGRFQDLDLEIRTGYDRLEDDDKITVLQEMAIGQDEC